jgi:hypothetical protein
MVKIDKNSAEKEHDFYPLYSTDLYPHVNSPLNSPEGDFSE